MNYKISLFLLLGYLFLCANSYASVYSDEEISGAITTENTGLFLEMMAAGVDVNEKDVEGNTPLIKASSYGKVNFVKFLLDMGADVHKMNYKGVTALHRAAGTGNNEIVNLLLDNNAFVDMPDLEGNTPLMAAVSADKFSTVELLIKRGSIVEFRNKKGQTAINIAKNKRFWKIYSYLIVDRSGDMVLEKKPSYSWDY